jgi:hypothetical protein
VEIVSEVLEVSSDWLSLREAQDSRARSRDLARAVLALLPDGPMTVHDLGSGTGSMMRWLAPLLPGPQAWVLHDWNANLTRHALDGEAPRDRDGAPVSITTRVGELEELRAADLEGASLVTASALLDVLTASEAHAIVEACVEVGAPTLLSLSVTGEVELRPWDARDKLFETAFNAHQRREVHDRRLLGRYGAPIVQGLFELAGWKVRKARTSWRIADTEPRLLNEWFDGWIDAAEEQSPTLRADAAGYRELRRSQLDRGELSAVVYHLDLLAWPR